MVGWGAQIIRLGTSGDVSNGRFDYPVGKLRLRETTEAMQRAEQNLDQIWRKFDDEMINRVGSACRCSAGAFEAIQAIIPWRGKNCKLDQTHCSTGKSFLRLS